MQLKFRENTLDEYIWKEQSSYLNKLILDKNDIWLDAGVNIGCFAISIAEKVCQVIAFEPDKENFELLKENVKISSFKNIEFQNFAIVGNDDKTRDFFLNTKKNKGSHSFLVKRGRDKVIVDCKNINQILKERKINKIKMDVEGAEYEILKVIEDFSKIEFLILEFHFNALKDKNHTKYFEIVELLKKNFNIVECKNDPGKSWNTLIVAKKNEDSK